MITGLQEFPDPNTKYYKHLFFEDTKNFLIMNYEYIINSDVLDRVKIYTNILPKNTN